MKTQYFAFAAAALVTACLGCQKDPNQNEFTYGTGSGGNAGTGTGAGGSGGGGTNPNGPIVGMALATFDLVNGAAPPTTGFALDNYHDTGANKNLNDPGNGLGNTPPTLSGDASDGSPNPGSLKIVAPYTGASQYVDLQHTIGTSTPQNWMGRTMHVRVKVSEGTFPGGIQVYVKTGTAYVFGGTYTNVAKNSNWQEFTVNVNGPMTANSGYDPTQVVAYGFQLNTGSAGASATSVTFNVDSFSVDPPLPGSTTDGGGGAAGGSGGSGGSPSDAAAGDATSN